MTTTKETRFIQPYLFFDGRCEEAVEFYRNVLGAEVTALIRFKDNPEPQEADKVPAGFGEKVMHCHSASETLPCWLPMADAWASRILRGFPCR